eukprot:CAMPEP_0197865852 /NCGR_PEP_ID=MMETSP1438-20131217/43898_1 /TAXON_ID=1461541 /ORGANISM="Pterosperma sp., Strain CCMP1384" /LENGTH=382 /DNA_ID=CAMNT_0043484369 /DNA_START=191 /DNA_END=1336 /DNA_ORIENTATION=-
MRRTSRAYKCIYEILWFILFSLVSEIAAQKSSPGNNNNSPSSNNNNNNSDNNSNNDNDNNNGSSNNNNNNDDNVDDDDMGIGFDDDDDVYDDDDEPFNEDDESMDTEDSVDGYIALPFFTEKTLIIIAFAFFCFLIITRGHYIKHAIEDSISSNLRRVYRNSSRNIMMASFGLADLASDLVFLMAIQQYSEYRTLTIICVVGMVLPFIVGAIITFRTISTHKDMLDSQQMKDHISLYSFLIVLACTQLECLSCLPWTEAAFDGLPSRHILMSTYATVLLEDIPQLCVQLTYAWNSTGRNHLVLYASLGFTATSLIFRVVSRYVVLSFTDSEGNPTGTQLPQTPPQGEDQDPLPSSSNSNSNSSRGPPPRIVVSQPQHARFEW